MQENMQIVEITAKSVQEATQVAADKLGVTPAQVKVTVLEETKGLFGKSSLRVRAEVVQAEPAAPAAQPKAKAAPKKLGTKAAAKPAPEPEPVAVAAVVEAPAAPAAKPRRGAKKPAAEAAPAVEAVAESTSDEPEAEVAATDADAENLAALLNELLESAGLTVSVVIGGISGRYVNLQLDGKDVAFLVGKHGEVLNAMQYLVNIIAGRRFNNGIRATLDGNDFRRRREDQLTQLATNIADQVKQRGEEAVLDALPAFERRIVHKALSVIEGITTYSEGEEPNRRVVIAPMD